MSGNDLLLWMSARGSGSMQQFRSAIERLRVEPEEYLSQDEGAFRSDWASETVGRHSIYTRLRWDLHCLSHAEFVEQSWRVTPSTLAITKHSDVLRGVWNGGRSPKLLEAFSRTYPGIEISIGDNPGNPDTVMVSAEKLNPITEFSKVNGLYVQEDAAAKLLVSYGHQRNFGNLREDPLPVGPGWQVFRFSVRNLEQHWLDASEDDVMSADRTSLFRYRSEDQELYFLAKSGRTFSINQQDGKYIVLYDLNRARLFRYDMADETLYLPGWFRPPLVVDRALTLTSGVIPKFDRVTRELAYLSVPHDLAKLTAHLVNQELKT